MSFDITLAFDKATYLNPQLYLFFNTIKDKLPDDTIIHIVTNRDNEDEIVKWLNHSRLKIKWYHNDNTLDDTLKSRCRYMLHCFEIETDKEWVVKMEADMLILKHLSCLEEIMKNPVDIILEPENRRIFEEDYADMLWPRIYRNMEIEYPDMEKRIIMYRENKEWSYPLFGTGMIIVRSKHLKKINERWIPLTQKCEPWIDLNIHPNEFAFTAMIFDEHWSWMTYLPKYKFNPIGHFRKGIFPSAKLIENCKLPEDIIIFDYHRPQWLYHVAKYNKHIMDILISNSDYIPDNWWDLPKTTFVENR